MAVKDIKQLKQLLLKRNSLMGRVEALDTQINGLLDEIPSKKEVVKQDHPKAGSGPDKLCKVMSSRPKSKAEIAQKTGLSEGTITLYLHQYKCFQSAGRGKGYIYINPAGETKAEPKAKAEPKTKAKPKQKAEPKTKVVKKAKAKKAKAEPKAETTEE